MLLFTLKTLRMEEELTQEEIQENGFIVVHWVQLVTIFLLGVAAGIVLDTLIGMLLFMK